VPAQTLAEVQPAIAPQAVPAPENGQLFIPAQNTVTEAASSEPAPETATEVAASAEPQPAEQTAAGATEDKAEKEERQSAHGA